MRLTFIGYFYFALKYGKLNIVQNIVKVFGIIWRKCLNG